jgi:dihydrofolate synthase / folylpolyglutamate synthase
VGSNLQNAAFQSRFGLESDRITNRRPKRLRLDAGPPTPRWRGALGAVLSTSYPESVRFLYALGNEFKTIKFGLDRSRALLDALGRPQEACRFVHVAGTNGKGSTCAFIERVLRQAGFRTGLYVSPHLVEPTERVRICGEPVTPEEFTAAFESVHSAAERLIASGGIDMHPTYFETMTAMAFHLFRERGTEVVVLETGMGGRLDATNVVTPLISVITPIDLDHEKYLGSTIPEIAYEKAGILKPGRPAVFSRQRPEALEVLDRRALEMGTPVTHATDWQARDLRIHAFGSKFLATNGATQLPVDCPLIGEHQVDNALTALASLSVLAAVDEEFARITPETIHNGIASTRWPGRLELVRTAPGVFLDGAHNPAGARVLAAYIRRFHADKKIWMVFGAMRDKDIHVMGPELFPLAHELVFTTPNQARAFHAAEISEISGEARAHVIDSPAEALQFVLKAPPEDVVFITGSLYLVGEIRADLGLVG